MQVKYFFKIAGLICGIIFSFPLFCQNSKIRPADSLADFSPNTIVFKVKETYRTSCGVSKIENSEFQMYFDFIKVNSCRKIFPGHSAPALQKSSKGGKPVDLSLIYRINYSSDISVKKAINKLLATGMVEYAEPYYIPKLTYVPNDTLAYQQYQLIKINAITGWDISRGDTNVVIGITDTGTDLTHPDLGNVKYNYADPLNGTDDDGDGYIDNFQGWDLAMNDNDPTWEANPHGMHVSGLAAASTDNITGVAGVGFKCKYLPVKISDNTGSLTKAYEGIVYAADHGCSVINCSWGSPGGGQFGQDIVNYAVFNKNAIVIAAAGNNGMLMDFYPASYDNVLSVAATDSGDVKWSGSNFGYNIDVCAPGNGVLSTWAGNTYVPGSGTSMASPITAGAAALVRTIFPSYTALQIGEQLKATCDDIYPLNSSYQDQLGNGRINVYSALTDSSRKSVVMTKRVISDNNDEAFNSNDTLRVSGTFTNFLKPLVNLNVTLSSASPDVSIIDGSSILGSMATLDTSNNYTDPFLVKILPSATTNESILFKLTYSDGSYSGVKYFTISVNVDYINIAINDVTTTVTSRGRIGYNKENQVEGLGFTYNGSPTLLYEASLMIGVPGSVSDMARGTGPSSDNDFMSLVSVKNVLPSVVSEFDIEGKFNDDLSPAPLEVLVSHAAYAWSTPGNTKYVILKYDIKNEGLVPLNNLYAGIFADWDIGDYSKNKVSYDPSLKMGYAWETTAGGIYTGIKLLSHSTAVHYAIDNLVGGSGGIDISDGFSTDEKYTALSTNRVFAGGTGTGNDIADVMSSGPFFIVPGQSTTISYALIGGDNLFDLQLSAANAQSKYDTLFPDTNNPIFDFALFQNRPNPVSGRTTIDFSIDQEKPVALSIIDITGRRQVMLVNSVLSPGYYSKNFDVSSLAAGMYFIELRSSEKALVNRLIVIK